jgi:hypothetical protein
LREYAAGRRASVRKTKTSRPQTSGRVAGQTLWDSRCGARRRSSCRSEQEV